MKKLLFIAMIIASVAAKAQGFDCNRVVPILTGDSVVFNLVEQPFDNIFLHLNKMNNNGGYDDVLYLDMVLQGKAATILTNTWKFNATNYSFPYDFPTNADFPISFGDKFSVSYNLPNVNSIYPFHYKHYYNYYPNYNSLFILLCPINSDGEIMGIFRVAEMPLSVTMIPSYNPYPYQPFQYWDCYGIGGSNDVKYYNDGMLIAHRIQPTTAFMDLWYTEYDEEPRNPNWRQHFTFVEAIDHFAIGFDFGY